MSAETGQLPNEELLASSINTSYPSPSTHAQPPVLPPPPPMPPLAPPLPCTIPLNEPNDADPKSTYRRMQWEKIPKFKISTENDTIWSPKISGGRPKIEVDTKTIHELFHLERKSKNIRSKSFPNVWNRNSKKDRGNEQLNSLLDSKKNMNINIFLRQFKRPVRTIIDAIRSCDSSLMTGDRLHSLVRLLPESEEAKLIRDYNGNVSQLDLADKFVFEVLSMEFYKARIEFSILRQEFEPTAKDIEDSLRTVQCAITEIHECKAFITILHLVLQTGNYLNRGVSYGNALGFRLSSLKKLSETKANKPGITVMHYVSMVSIAMQVVKQKLP